MRASRFSVVAIAVGAVAVLAGCAAGAGADAGDDGGEVTAPVTLQVAAVTSPMTDVVEAAAEAIEDGYEIELVEVADYITANTILNDGDVYANFSQHEPYMQSFNEGNNGSLVAVQPVYNFVIAFYSKSLTDIADLPAGATIAIPDDPSNTGRALKLLAAEGIVTLDPAVDPYDATVDDIVENPKQVEFLQVPISSLNAAYEEADLVFQWPSHIAALGLNPQDDGLLTELDETFALNLVVGGDDASSEATAALTRAFTSDAVREVIESNETIEVAF
ncbi:MetQ/NlpA family ABC transporter substrate-binding protein [Microbacterium sp. zg.Y625]|uniref:MetQ/NlpA family ABC transporter substrate-binding protein n=1 Tax=Microbacterium jiangjiandongii TaxID=3049071 RepID=UPI00214BB61F|nr:MULTISPECIES: MetQ/NlpA family ABC transporter substrate-binding protein [unclassified Microbacterium]MCR2793052.1 MetQ/NlpA family ABC transporter substrate-binding protein [Microbacterium sp. zg.Y625]WIM24166.1 MetQ/NlpA family ABC transporter substrate-binding protein [Microbacterium sp. zg-Y625]